jgi:outer membrane efflux protein
MLATSRNLSLEAARRQRAIREAGVRTARQIPNPDVTFEVTQDIPHQIVNFNLPVEIGGKRTKRIDLAREEITLADVAVQLEMRAIRRELRQSFYSLIAADLQVELADSVVEIARRVRDAAQARFDSGAAPRLDVLQADLGVTRAETELDLARSARAAARASLRVVQVPRCRAVSRRIARVRSPGCPVPPVHSRPRHHLCRAAVPRWSIRPAAPHRHPVERLVIHGADPARRTDRKKRHHPD